MGGLKPQGSPSIFSCTSGQTGLAPLEAQNLMDRVITYKHIWPQNIMDWVHLPSWNKKGISVIYKVVIQTLPIIKSGLTWKIGNGSIFRIRADPWIGCGNMYNLPPDLIAYLNKKGVQRGDLDRVSYSPHFCS